MDKTLPCYQYMKIILVKNCSHLVSFIRTIQLCGILLSKGIYININRYMDFDVLRYYNDIQYNYSSKKKTRLIDDINKRYNIKFNIFKQLLYSKSRQIQSIEDNFKIDAHTIRLSIINKYMNSADKYTELFDVRSNIMGIYKFHYG